MNRRAILVAIVLLFLLGVICVAIGCGLIPYFNKKIKDTVNENVKLKNNSDAFKTWIDPPAPIFIEFTFFNLTNPDEVVAGTSKPRVVEVGPFVYREYRNKTDINITDDGVKIQYREHKYYVFQKEMSHPHSEDTPVCTINIPILTLATYVRFMSSFIQKILSVFLKLFHETLFQTHTVKELLWGYTPESIKKINDILNKTGIQYRINFTYGIYSGPTANGTDYGQMEIFSGVGNITDLGLVDTWNGKKNLSYWMDECNMIKGSDGTLWHPFIDESDTLYIFNTDLCRSVYTRYSGSSSVSNIPTYHLTPPPESMANSTVNPKNKCFCADNGTLCLGAGVLNVSSCRQGAPVIMSQPHFFEAASEYQNAIIGLKPNKKLHQTVIDVEPMTGLVLNAAKKIQVNMFITNLQALNDTKNFNSSGMIFPISWMNEHATISDDGVAKFRHQILVPIMEANGVRYGLIALGCFLLLIALILVAVLCFEKRKAKKEAEDDEPLLDDHNEG